jgi:hypothetical protein
MLLRLKSEGDVATSRWLACAIRAGLALGCALNLQPCFVLTHGALSNVEVQVDPVQRP